MKKNRYFKYCFLCILTAALTFFDQFSKYLVINRLNLSKNYPVLKHLISFEYLENQGVAFGILSGKMVFINIIVAIVSICIIYFAILLEKAIRKQDSLFVKFTFLQILCSALVAGALGNIIDRIRFGYVVDFIKFDFIDFPTFNVADCYVTISVVLLLIALLFFVSEDDLDNLKNHK